MSSEIKLPGEFSLTEGQTPAELIDGYKALASMTANGEEGAKLALITIFEFAGSDGEHHKDWVLDQVVQALTGEKYDEFVAYFQNGIDGPHTYTWNTGIAP